MVRPAERMSVLVLGRLFFFVLHIGGLRYGVRKPEATMLACSFDEVQSRVAFRGKRIAPLATEPDAGAIADAFRNALYADEREAFKAEWVSAPQFPETSEWHETCLFGGFLRVG